MHNGTKKNIYLYYILNLNLFYDYIYTLFILLDGKNSIEIYQYFPFNYFNIHIRNILISTKLEQHVDPSFPYSSTKYVTFRS